MFKYFIYIIVIFSLFLQSCEEKDPCLEDPESCFVDQLKVDISLIETYIEENNLDMKQHESALYYKVNNPGVTDSAKAGQTLYVDYIGKLLDGTVFDTSIDSVARAEGIYSSSRDYIPFSFKLGNKSVIDGWEIGLRFFEEGGKGTLIVPSYLGYGDNATTKIPASSVLIFEIDLVDVKF